MPERLRSYRRVHGISREKLAGMLRVDEGTLWRWETGQRQPKCEYACRIRVLPTHLSSSVGTISTRDPRIMIACQAPNS